MRRRRSRVNVGRVLVLNDRPAWLVCALIKSRVGGVVAKSVFFNTNLAAFRWLFCAGVKGPGTLVRYEQTVRLSWEGNQVPSQGEGCGRVCTGPLVRYEQTVRLSWEGNRWPSQGGGCGSVCTDTQVHYEQTVREGDASVCVRVHWYTIVCVRVHWYTVSKQSGRRMRQCVYGCTGTL